MHVSLFHNFLKITEYIYSLFSLHSYKLNTVLMITINAHQLFFHFQSASWKITKLRLKKYSFNEYCPYQIFFYEKTFSCIKNQPNNLAKQFLILSIRLSKKYYKNKLKNLLFRFTLTFLYYISLFNNLITLPKRSGIPLPQSS